MKLTFYKSKVDNKLHLPTDLVPIKLEVSESGMILQPKGKKRCMFCGSDFTKNLGYDPQGTNTCSNLVCKAGYPLTIGQVTEINKLENND